MSNEKCSVGHRRCRGGMLVHTSNCELHPNLRYKIAHYTCGALFGQECKEGPQPEKVEDWGIDTWRRFHENMKERAESAEAKVMELEAENERLKILVDLIDSGQLLQKFQIVDSGGFVCRSCFGRGQIMKMEHNEGCQNPLTPEHS